MNRAALVLASVLAACSARDAQPQADSAQPSGAASAVDSGARPAGRAESTGVASGASPALPTSGWKRPAYIKLDDVTTTGSLVREEATRRVNQNRGRIRLCYEKALKDSPALRGAVSIMCTVKPDGTTAEVKVTSKEITHDAMLDCLKNAFEKVTFPEVSGSGAKVTVRWIFDPDDQHPAGSARAAAPAERGPTIGGKPLAKATAFDVDKALKAAGAFNIAVKTVEGSKGAFRFVCMTDKDSFTVTFVPASSGPNVLAKDEEERLIANAATKREGAFFLAVESPDKTKATLFLNDLIIE